MRGGLFIWQALRCNIMQCDMCLLHSFINKTIVYALFKSPAVSPICDAILL